MDSAQQIGTRTARLRRWAEPALLAATTMLLAAGATAWFLGGTSVANGCWIAGTGLAIPPAAAWVAARLRQGRAGVDAIALLALCGTLAVHEYLAGSLIAVMLATGRALEAAANRRAARDLHALLTHAPRTARTRRGHAVSRLPLQDVLPGDVLIVGPGEVVPVDGRLLSTWAVLDESVLTGESRHAEFESGEPLRSGTVNAGPAFDLRATATAEDSTYAGIVRLAAEASAESAPVVRMADRYAGWFLPLTLVISGAAVAVTGSLYYAVAVLVVATPCPLLLAAPVAIVSGMSRAARSGVVVRGGAALETLGRARTLVLDKTGTLTVGRPTVAEVVAAPGWDTREVLRIAASADLFSPHVLAEAIVFEARRTGLYLSTPKEVFEEPGRGVRAIVDGQQVQVGAAITPGTEHAWTRSVLNRAQLDVMSLVWLHVDDQPVGAVLLHDALRYDTPRTLRRLRASGLSRQVLLTGDRAESAVEVGTLVGLDDVRCGQTPEQKVEFVRRERQHAVTVMVGDGVNDAAALATADVGVAMGSRGATASSEAADIVLTTDHIGRLADAMDIARKSRRIAAQSAVAGMAMSLVAMVAAAFGWLPPTIGALLQEGIDVAVIVNALRALRSPPVRDVRVSPSTALLLEHFAAEHDRLRGTLPLLRETADLVHAEAGPEALLGLRRIHEFLTNELVPHELAEEKRLYPVIATSLGSAEATATMSRTHAEIQRLSRRLATHLHQAEQAGAIGPTQVHDLLACLYGLFSVLRLHFAQEEESYFALSTPAGDTDGAGHRRRAGQYSIVDSTAACQRGNLVPETGSGLPSPAENDRSRLKRKLAE